MGIWRSLARAVLSEYGLIGRAIADKIDRVGASFDEQPTFNSEALCQMLRPQCRAQWHRNHRTNLFVRLRIKS